MAYPGHHPGMGSMYSYGSNPAHYQRQNPLPPPAPLMIPPNIPSQIISQPTYQHHPQYSMPSATTTSTEPPQTPSHDSEADDEANRSLPEILPISKTHNGRVYALKVVQQPERARMCGFGDKDRRPISPPPCVKLCIYDLASGQAREIDYSKIDDLSRYVVMVDLACVDTLVEKNLCTHPALSPSISTVTTSAFPATQTNASPSRGSVQSYPVSNLPEYSSSQYAYSGPNRQGQTPYWGNGSVSHEYARQYPPHPFQGHNPYTGNYNGPNAAYSTDQGRGSINGGRNQVSGTLSRNLIGSLSGSAFKLKDLENKPGLWFVFQDLSVRTEGWFRLKFTFFDLKDALSPDATSEAQLSKFAPMLACAYSKAFKVYSAKKFPGVIESTPLSKKFAEQGIKIPIRKDGGREFSKPGDKRKRKGSDDEEDGSGDEEGED